MQNWCFSKSQRRHTLAWTSPCYMRAVVIKSPANAGWGGGKGLIAIYTSEPAVKHQRGRFHQVIDITGRVWEGLCTRHVTYTLFRETLHQRLRDMSRYVTYTLLRKVLCELHIKNIGDAKVRTAFVVEHRVVSCFSSSSSYVRLMLLLRIQFGDFSPHLSFLCFRYYFLINLIVLSFKFKSKAFSKLPKKTALNKINHVRILFSSSFL